jgi:ribonucleoside-diphosphate reductase alpha chain
LSIASAPWEGVERELSPDTMSPFAETIYKQKYAWRNENDQVIEEWPDTAWRVTSNVMSTLGYESGDREFDNIYRFILQRKFLPGGRYLYASGRGLHQTQNCLLLRAEDSREGWSDLMHKSGMALMTGAGIGIDYSSVRQSNSPIKRTGGVASGPIALMKIINEIGRGVMQGGSRRSAIWAGLSWKHGDIFDFIRLKDWPEDLRKFKEEDPNFPMPMEYTNISVLLDDEFFEAFENEDHSMHGWAQDVYWKTLDKMLTTAEPGFSVDIGRNAGETLRNACTEVTSSDDSDICNLGSINLARIENLDEMREVVEAATLFLLAGTVYSDVPYQQVADIRQTNRRLGLGLMGVHEWLLQREKSYGPDDELGKWLDIYAEATDYAALHAGRFNLTLPVKTRAIAPTGTIAIIGETTTGIEPIFCVAYKRRYRTAKPNGQDVTQFQYVIDPTAKRLVERGIEAKTIEDAYMLSYDVERRIKFQAWMQRYVDHGISSTINLPYAITEERDQRAFGEMLMRYLPELRGVTVYPDGARGGQPLVAVPYHVAAEQEGVVFEESDERCASGACGI